MAISLITARTNRTVTVSAANLFQVAADELGDATQWTRIARINGLVDPFITGIVTLKIPAVDPTAGNGGVLL
jgi:hypothetical protein